jgi:hypothetical protein
MGKSWEEEVQRDTGGRLQPNSGATPFFKLDIEGAGSFLISAKATDFLTYPLGAAAMQEVEHALLAPGGLGPGVLPILAIRVRGAKFGVVRWDDFVDMASEERTLFRESKTAAKRRRALTPQLLREDGPE